MRDAKNTFIHHDSSKNVEYKILTSTTHISNRLQSTVGSDFSLFIHPFHLPSLYSRHPIVIIISATKWTLAVKRHYPMKQATLGFQQFSIQVCDPRMGCCHIGDLSSESGHWTSGDFERLWAIVRTLDWHFAVDRWPSVSKMNLLTFIRLVRPRAYHLLSRQHLPFTSTRKHDAKRQDFRRSLPESFPNFGVQLKMCKTLRCMRDCIHRRRPSTPSLLDWWMPEPYKSPKIRNLTCISRFPS